MTNILRAAVGFTLLLAFLPINAQATDCDRNFRTAGSILTGKRFATVANLPNVTADSAYQSAYKSIAKQGFIIQQSDSSARVIAALDSNSAPGRPAPLNVTVETGSGGSTITLIFGTPPGAFALEGSVKDEFCKIVSAAGTHQQQMAYSTPVEVLQRSEDRINAIPHPNASTERVCMASACIGMSLEEVARLNLKAVPTSRRTQNNFAFISDRFGEYGLDANGKVIAMNSTSIDRAWIQEFLHTVHTMCVPPGRLSAEISASDGTPIQLGFNLREQNGKPGYVLFSISRVLPNNMSASEQRRLVEEVRNRYGRSFIEESDIGRTISASNGELAEGVAMVFPSSVELRGPGTPRALGPKLMEQPGCSNRIQLD